MKHLAVGECVDDLHSVMDATRLASVASPSREGVAIEDIEPWLRVASGVIELLHTRSQLANFLAKFGDQAMEPLVVAVRLHAVDHVVALRADDIETRIVFGPLVACLTQAAALLGSDGRDRRTLTGVAQVAPVEFISPSGAVERQLIRVMIVDAARGLPQPPSTKAPLILRLCEFRQHPDQVDHHILKIG